jgi:hypothetical protein
MSRTAKHGTQGPVPYSTQALVVKVQELQHVSNTEVRAESHTGNRSSLQCQEVGRRKGAKDLVVIWGYSVALVWLV